MVGAFFERLEVRGLFVEGHAVGFVDDIDGRLACKRKASHFGNDFAGRVDASVFRLVASGALMWYMFKLIKKGTSTSVVGYLTLILAGAIGNLIDSCFYGLIFNESTYQVAHLFPSGGGYAPFMQGKVVDMFYFPLFQFTWPEWVPFVGGTSDVFFNAIFNVADASITIGAIWLIVDLLFFADKRKEKNEASDTINDKKTVSNPQKS